MIKETQLSKSEHLRIYDYCQKNIDYLCTAFNLDSIKFLNNNFNMKYFKIASGEIFSIDVLEYISKYKKIILSTGSAFIEIKQSLKIINSNFKKYYTSSLYK